MARGEIHIELAVSYADDPKVAALARWPKDARGARDLYVQMICYAKQNMTDGEVPTETLGKLAYPDPIKVATRQALMLIEVGLIEPSPKGWLVLAFLKRNKSRAEVIALSETRSEFGRVGGLRSGEVRQPATKRKAARKQVASVGLNTESESESESESKTSIAATPRARDMIWDAVVEACGINDQELTKIGSGPVAAAVRDLKAVGATPAQITLRSRNYRARYKDADLTPTALAKHWASLEGNRPTAATEQIMARAADPLASAR